MKFYGQRCAVDDPESGALRVFQVDQRDDKLRGFGVKSLFGVSLGKFRGAVWMRVIDRDKPLSRIPQIAQNLNEFGRIHLVFSR